MGQHARLRVVPTPPREDEEDQQQVEKWETAKQQRKTKLEWLLPGRVLKGAHNILEGVKGSGKSTFSAYLAACITTGKAPWKGKKGKPRKVIWLPGEEDVELFIRPRLEAAKARLDWVIFPPKNHLGIREILRFPGDTERLFNQIKEHNAGMVIIDPLGSHVPRDHSLTTDQDIHAVLDPMAGIAAALKIPFLICRNLTKNTRADAIDRGLGGAAVAGVARSVCTIDYPDRKSPKRILRVTGGNHSFGFGPLEYSIAGSKDFGFATAFKELATEDDKQQSADDDDGERSAKDDARVMLLRLLKAGPAKTVDILKEATSIGIGARTVRTVQKHLGIRPVRRVIQGVAHWEWHAPDGGFPKGS